MLFTALFNVICSYNTCLFICFSLDVCIVIICTNAFCFYVLSMGYRHIACTHVHVAIDT